MVSWNYFYAYRMKVGGGLNQGDCTSHGVVIQVIGRCLRKGTENYPFNQIISFQCFKYCK